MSISCFFFLSFLHLHQPGFYKGVAGSQVTLSSLVNQSRAMLDEQARHLLTEVERQTMNYYVEEYRDGHIGVEQLVMALFELLNTHAKVRLVWTRLRKEGRGSRENQCSPAQLVCAIAVRFELKFSEIYSQAFR